MSTSVGNTYTTRVYFNKAGAASKTRVLPEPVAIWNEMVCSSE